MHIDDDYSNERMIGLRVLTVNMAYKSRTVSQHCDTEAEQMLCVFSESLLSSSATGPYFHMMPLKTEINIFGLNRW